MKNLLFALAAFFFIALSETKASDLVGVKVQRLFGLEKYNEISLLSSTQLSDSKLNFYYVDGTLDAEIVSMYYVVEISKKDQKILFGDSFFVGLKKAVEAQASLSSESFDSMMRGACKSLKSKVKPGEPNELKFYTSNNDLDLNREPELIWMKSRCN